MKNPLLTIALGPVFEVSSVRAASSDSTDTTYSHPAKYMAMMRSPDWWNSGAHRDWGGPRNTLYDDGVSIFANYTNNIAGNPVGGKKAPDLLIAITSVLDSTWTLGN